MFRKVLKVLTFLFLVSSYQVQPTLFKMNTVLYILFTIKIIRIENLNLQMMKYLARILKNLRWMNSMDLKISKFLFLQLEVIT